MTSETGGAHYTYRADGMRTQKVTDCSYSWYYDEINDSSFYDEVTTVNKPTTRYFYDGQMACEEDFAELVPNEDPFFEVTRYGLGARGVDWIEKATVEDTSISFPIYDGHGNVIAQLGRTGSSYSLTQVKSYDVWGGVRSGTLGPPGRYCGNLGHVSDDESGLVYMRARYYEPGSGRFISEDPAMDGQNWFAYCGNDPVGRIDQNGRHWTEIAGTVAWMIGSTYAATSFLLLMYGNSLCVPLVEKAMFRTAAMAGMQRAVVYFCIALGGVDSSRGVNFIMSAFLQGLWSRLLTSIAVGIESGSRSSANAAVFAVGAYSLVVLAGLMASLVVED